MDRHSWPWKKKSGKTSATTATPDSVLSLLTSACTQDSQDTHKKPSYVQISAESYTHLTGLEAKLIKNEEQIQAQEVQIKDLTEKLTEANAEIISNEKLVKQHAKVAEEAVSGWEKAEAEALALKNHLESVTLLKLTAEDRASHLDGALKECMKQIRNLKEEHEIKLQEVIHTKTKQHEQIVLEFEAKIDALDQELRRFTTENGTLSRTLQERSNMLIKINEEKLQAEAEIELLKSTIESCDRDINSLKYEHHLISKELEIRNEEKNMSMRSAEVANKQHMEGVKKISKLEAECQRLRGLVRKKLPGPAALAQMKLEVESLGRDYGESPLKRSPARPPNPNLTAISGFALDNVQKFHKGNEYLTERLLAMEDETKLLKEALAKRNSELLASRNMCGRTASKLQSLEEQLQMNGQKSPQFNVPSPAASFPRQNASYPPSIVSMSEDGMDDDRSFAESWTTSLISEFSHVKKDKNFDRSNKGDGANHLELMDDFLEMEKLACVSNDLNGSIFKPENSDNKRPETINPSGLKVTDDNELPSEQLHDMIPSTNQLTSNEQSDANQLPLMKLRSRISMVVESMSNKNDMGKIMEDIKCIVQDAYAHVHQPALTCVSVADNVCSGLNCPGNSGEITVENNRSMSLDSKGLAIAITQIYEFVSLVGKEATTLSPDGHGLSEKIDTFTVTFNKVLSINTGLVDFIVDLSNVLAIASELRFNFLGYKSTESGFNLADCVDKVVLPENKTVQKNLSGEMYQNGCSHISDTISDLGVPDAGSLVSTYEPNTITSKLSLDEFEQLRSEKDKLIMDLARYKENLEMTKSQLQETEVLLVEAKSQLASTQKSNSLAETQLKCMAESYRSIEKRAEELEAEVSLLRVKTDALEDELKNEKTSNQGSLARCNDLEEQLQRHEDCSVESKQDKELAAASEKLAECQETIFLLGEQLKGFRPQSESPGSSNLERYHRGNESTETEPTNTRSSTNFQDINKATVDNAASANMQRLGTETPTDLYSSQCSPFGPEATIPTSSPVSSKHPKHRHSKSSSLVLSATSDKHSRGFSRFFSSKGKN